MTIGAGFKPPHNRTNHTNFTSEYSQVPKGRYIIGRGDNPCFHAKIGIEPATKLKCIHVEPII